MVEKGYPHLRERPANTGPKPASDINTAKGPRVAEPATKPTESKKQVLSESERRRILIGGAKQVGPALFFSLLIIVVSFLPVFLLEAQEGRMFKPLAWPKTLPPCFSSLPSIPSRPTSYAP